MADWVDDETLSREETLERFHALGPELTTGPVDQGVRLTDARRIKIRLWDNRLNQIGVRIGQSAKPKP